VIPELLLGPDASLTLLERISVSNLYSRCFAAEQVGWQIDGNRWGMGKMRERVKVKQTLGLQS